MRGGGGAEGESPRADSPLSAKPDTGLDFTAHEITTWAKTELDSSPTESPRRPRSSILKQTNNNAANSVSKQISIILQRYFSNLKYIKIHYLFLKYKLDPLPLSSQQCLCSEFISKSICSMLKKWVKIRLQMNTVKKSSCNVEAFNQKWWKYGFTPYLLICNFAKVIETV